MRTFSIAELETLSGIRAHTLRMWEKRYLAFSPLRKKGNVREYSIDDLRRFLQLSLLNNFGFKVSALSAVSADELEDKINELPYDDARQRNAVNELIICMYRLDIEHFEFIVQKCLATWGVDVFLSEIVYKFLEKTGLLWHGKRLTEEHFVVTALRSKIIHCIEQVETYGKKEVKILLFLPQAGQVDLMLLYTMYQLKQKGFIIYYMGHDVSISNLRVAIQSKQPNYVFSYFPEKTNFRIRELAELMNNITPAAKCIIANNPKGQSHTTDHQNVVYLGFEEALSFVSMESTG